MGTWFPDRWKRVLRRTASALATDDRDHALEILEGYARRKPKDPSAWCIWAKTVEHLGDRPTAERILREGLVALPRDPLILATLAGMLSLDCSGPDDPRWIEGGNLLDLASEREPELPEVLVERFDRLTRGLDFDEMFRLGRLARQRMSFDEPHERALAFELAMAMIGVPALHVDAESLFRTLVSITPDNPIPDVYLAALLGKSDPTLSEQHLQRARENWSTEAREDIEAFFESIKQEMLHAEKDES